MFVALGWNRGARVCVILAQDCLRNTVAHFLPTLNQNVYVFKKRKEKKSKRFIFFCTGKCVCCCLLSTLEMYLYLHTLEKCVFAPLYKGVCFTVRYAFAIFWFYMRFSYAPFAKLMPKGLRSVYYVLRKDNCRVTKENICLFY